MEEHHARILDRILEKWTDLSNADMQYGNSYSIYKMNIEYLIWREKTRLYETRIE